MWIILSAAVVISILVWQWWDLLTPDERGDVLWWMLVTKWVPIWIVASDPYQHLFVKYIGRFIESDFPRGEMR